jgi:mRNA interferase MazF
MDKNNLFNKWNEEKKEINNNNLKVFAKPRQVCYIKLGCNVGYEEDGKRWFMRPVLIINKIGILYFVIPLTSKEKINPYHYQITSISFNQKKTYAILSQWRIIDWRRLIEKKWVCSKEEFLIIKKILRNMYFPE